MTLRKVTRTRNGLVKIELTIDARPEGAKRAYVSLGDIRVFVDGKETSPQCDHWSKRGRIWKTASFKVKPRARRLTIVQEVRVVEKRRFRFAGASGGTLPVTRRIGKGQVTLRRTYCNRTAKDILKDRRWWGYSDRYEGRPVYAVELEVKPAWVATLHFRYDCWKNGDSFHWSGSYEMHEDRRARLTDDVGRVHAVADVAYDENAADGQTDVFAKGTKHWTIIERAAGTLAPRFAGKMVDRRARNTANAAINHDIYLYMFPAIYPEPKSFDLDLTIPCLKGRAEAVFEDVPIP
ncbi:MAG: hypothetical protein Q7T82_08695 [Armatimonadota bacterium]|nr:hypothetical protein [Armatimonadota bacterium]